MKEVRYMCDKCGDRWLSHKDMHNDMICVDCWERTEKELGVDEKDEN